MKKTIRLNESEFRGFVRNLVGETIRSLNEAVDEGTPKQNAFLRKLMGDRYKDEYDDMDVRSTSAMIDQELERQRNGSGNNGGGERMATPKQIEFLTNNKYYPVQWVNKIADKLTFSDASEMCDQVSPYQGNANYYGQIRTRKEIWIPNRTEVLVKMANKYGLPEDAAMEQSVCDQFMGKYNAKIDRERTRRENETRRMFEEEKRNSIVFVSTQSEEANSPIPYDYQFYMEGKLEDAMSWDMVGLKPGCEEKFQEFADTARARLEGRGWGAGTYAQRCFVEGYDNRCMLLVWMGIHPTGRRVMGGILCDASEWMEFDKKAKQLASRYSVDF